MMWPSRWRLWGRRAGEVSRQSGKMTWDMAFRQPIPVLPEACNSGVELRLAEAACNVVLRLLELGHGEDLVGGTGLDQLAHVKERRALRDASSLRHGVGDDNNAGVFAQLVDKRLDVGGGDGV